MMDKTPVDNKEKGHEAVPNACEGRNSDPRSLLRGLSDYVQIGRIACSVRDGLVMLLTWIGQAICRGFRVGAALLTWATAVTKGQGRSLTARPMPLESKRAAGYELYYNEDVTAHEDHAVSTRTTPIIYIPESELRTMAGISALWYGLEAGGEIYALWTPKGNIVICIVSGPAARAAHQPAYFCQDLESFRRVSGVIWGAYAVPPGGCHHSHGPLGLSGLSGPSAFDIDQVRRIATRNNLDRWCDIITSYADEGSRGGRNNGPTGGPPWWQGCPRIRMRAFVYTDPQGGTMREACIQVLPGISAYRTMALAGGQLKPEDLGAYASSFPLEKIVLDSPESPESSSADSPALFESLAEQCRELPSELQNGIQFHARDGYVVVTLAMSRNKTLHIFYGEKPPYLLRGVFLHHHGAARPEDVTGMVPRGRHGTSLKDICRAVL